MLEKTLQELYNSVKDWKNETDSEAQIEAYENVLADIEVSADKLNIQLEGIEEK